MAWTGRIPTWCCRISFDRRRVSPPLGGLSRLFVVGVFLVALWVPVFIPSAGQAGPAEVTRSVEGKPRESMRSRARILGERLLAAGVLWDERELARLRDSLPRLSSRERLERRYQVLRRLIWLGRREEVMKEAARLKAESRALGADDWYDVARLIHAYLPAMRGHRKEALAAIDVLAGEFAARHASAHVLARLEAMRVGLMAELARPDEAMAAMEAAYRHLGRMKGEMRRVLARELAMEFAAVSALYLDIDGMMDAYANALALTDPGDLSPNIAQAVHALGNVLSRLQEDAAARQLFEGLRDLGRRRQSSKAIFLGEYGLMKVAHNRSMFSASDAHARAALAAMTPPARDRVIIAQHMALNALGRDEIKLARRHLETARRILVQLAGQRNLEIASYDHLIEAGILSRQGRLNEALAALRRYARMRLRAVHELYRRESAFLLSRLVAERDAMRLQSAEAIAEASRGRLLLREQRIGIISAAILAFVLLLAFAWQKRVAQRLREARSAADAANRAKSEFLANISHELRTPLNAILGFSELMERELFGKLGDRRYREYAAAVHRSGSHLLAVINDILDLSRVEAGELQLEEEIGDVRDDIAAAGELVAQRMEDHGQRLVLDIPADFPKLRADHRLLRQIFLNLLSNAVKFSPHGAPIVIGARVEQVPAGGTGRQAGAHPQGQDELLCFSVTDDGPGLTEEQQRIALEPFGQVSVIADHDREGSGLGLSLVQRFVALHGGAFELESAPGRGTRARFWLPGWRAVREPSAGD